MADPQPADNEKASARQLPSLALIYAAFIAGLCSIIYELLIATTTSYFFGDSVKYFSLTIGIYMAAMGLGSYVSKYVDDGLLEKFIGFEIALALLGGSSIPVLYFSYALTNVFMPAYVFFTVSIGFFIGLEIPFLTRLMQTYNRLQVNIANVLSFDYLGALIATVAFPFFLLPFLGVYQSSLAFGLVNLSIALVLLYVFKDELDGARRRLLKAVTLLVGAVLVMLLVFSNTMLNQWDDALYEDRVIHAEQSRYQRIVMTKNKYDVRLYLNGNLQFSSVDEYRYHEALVMVPLAIDPQPARRVLLLGAGDGLAVRELLRYPEIESITLVDLDDAVTELAMVHPQLTALNSNSLEHDNVE